MTQGVYDFSGPGFSPLGDKGRFVLPPKFRKTLKESNGGEKTLYLDKHASFPCLTGFGESRKQQIAEEIRGDSLNAQERELAYMQLYSFTDVPFDDSGRFVMPRHMMELVGITGAVYFHGTGPYFTIWDPAALLAMEGPHFVTAQAHCRAAMAAAEAKGRKA